MRLNWIGLPVMRWVIIAGWVLSAAMPVLSVAAVASDPGSASFSQRISSALDARVTAHGTVVSISTRPASDDSSDFVATLGGPPPIEYVVQLRELGRLAVPVSAGVSAELKDTQVGDRVVMVAIPHDPDLPWPYPSFEALEGALTVVFFDNQDNPGRSLIDDPALASVLRSAGF